MLRTAFLSLALLAASPALAAAPGTSIMDVNGAYLGTDVNPLVTRPPAGGANATVNQGTANSGGASAWWVQWSGQSVAVSALPSLPAGANVIGKVGIDQTTPGTTNGVIVNGGNLNSNIFAAYSASLVTANPGGNQPQLDVRGQFKTSAAGSSDPLVGITPAVTQSGTTLVGKGSTGNLYAYGVTNLSTTAGFVAVINAASVPTSGTAIAPLECRILPASGSTDKSYDPGPPPNFSAGVVVLVTTSCATYTPGGAAFINALVR